MESTMKTNAVSLSLALLVLGFAAPAWNARGQADATEKIGKLKQQAEEQRQAQLESIRKGFSAGAVQKELDQLNTKKADLEKELEYTRLKLNAANRDLKIVELTNDAER